MAWDRIWPQVISQHMDKSKLSSFNLGVSAVFKMITGDCVGSDIYFFIFGLGFLGCLSLLICVCSLCQWETSLQCNAVSHRLSANLEPALPMLPTLPLMGYFLFAKPSEAMALAALDNTLFFLRKPSKCIGHTSAGKCSTISLLSKPFWT